MTITDRQSNNARLLTTADAAEQLGVSKRTVERMVSLGQIAVVRPSERTVRIPQSVIDERLTPTTTTKPAGAQP